MRSLTILLLCLAGAFGVKAGTLTGTVKDSEGAAISNAEVIVHWDPSGANYLPDNISMKADVTATTDKDGRFSIDLPPGFYDVFVTAMAFSPRAEKIRLRGNGSHRKDFTLDVSAVTSKELD